MPAVASIALFDAQATPVSHTFLPLGPDANGVWWFEDQSQSNVIGYWRVSVQLTRTKPAGNGAASAANRVNRVKIGLHMPTQETLGTSDSGITPPPTVAYVTRAMIELIMPERNTLQNRKDLRKMTSNVLADANITTLIESLQPYF